MRKIMFIFIMVWISGGLLSACASSKATVFGEDMPSMKTVHDQKFQKTLNEKSVRPHRIVRESLEETRDEFVWLPNPILTLYVFKHLTAAGHPVPGYSTFFRMYTRDHIADPDEQGGWE